MKILTTSFFATSIAMSTTGAQAQFNSAYELAAGLGMIIASEQLCDLTYNQEAIQTWIANNTDASSMTFPSLLSMGIEAEKFRLEDSIMTQSEKTTHCTTVTRAARHFGFVE